MYSGRHCGERLFRPSSRLTWVIAVVGAALVRDRRLPAHTGRRVAVTAVALAALGTAQVVVPVHQPSGTALSAEAGAISSLTERPAELPPELGSDGTTPPAATSSRPTALRPPMPATPLMREAPPLPAARARAGRALLFTFDDGPDPRFTPQVLALLAGYDARAVFCVVGREAQQHPEMIRAIVAAGHELCNHTASHDEDLALKPGVAVRADLAATQEILRRITGGVVPRYMRAPGGRWSPTLIAEARALELQPLGWSVDPRDWSEPGLRHIVDTVLREAAPGGVVVMHDGGGGERERTVQALGFLLRRLRRLGYVFR